MQLYVPPSEEVSSGRFAGSPVGFDVGAALKGDLLLADVFVSLDVESIDGS